MRGALLLARKREGHGGEQGPHVRPVDHVRVRSRALERDGLTGEQGRLQAQKLVEGEAAPGVLGGDERAGEVRLAKGAGLGHEAVRGHEGGRHEVAGVAVVGERGRGDAAHPRRREPLGDAVDGQDAGVGRRLPGSLRAATPSPLRARLALGRLAHHLVELRPHLPESVGERHLARDGELVTHVELLGQPRLLEEGAHDDARVVHERHLHELHARLGALERDLVHHAHERDLAAHVGAPDGSHAREVEVAVRHVEQGVAHGIDAHTRKRLRTGRRRIAQARDVAVPRPRAGEARCRLAYGRKGAPSAGHASRPTRLRR